VENEERKDEKRMDALRKELIVPRLNVASVLGRFERTINLGYYVVIRLREGACACGQIMSLKLEAKRRLVDASRLPLMKLQSSFPPSLLQQFYVR